MSKLFLPVFEGHDPINRQVFICQDKQGKYVYKPANGFKTRHYTADDEKLLQAAFERQCGYGHTHADYLPEEEKAEGEEYPLLEDGDVEEILNGVLNMQAADVPAADAPVVDTPAADGPAADAPVVDTPVVDTPAADAPAADAPVVDNPADASRKKEAEKSAKKTAAKKSEKKTAAKKSAKKTAAKK